MKLLLMCVCAALLLTAGAQAQAAAPADTRADELVLQVHAAHVQQGALEQALGAELASEPVARGRLELSDRPGGVLRLSYRDALGKETTRELRVAPDDPEALEKITLAAANLLRDQSGLAAELAARLPPAPAAPAPPASLYNPCAALPVRVFGGDLLPSIGTSGSAAGRSAARRLSLNLLGGYSAGVRGFEASLGFNIDRRGACGFMGAVGFNLALGPVRGTQLALVNLGASQVRGAQLGLVNFARGRASAQLGLSNTALGAGAQLGVANAAFGDVGGQAGVANLAWGNLRRVQLGVLNVARDAPVQLGVVNVSRSARAPIGVVSIVRDGRTSVDAWATENGTLLAGVAHGGDYVHNLYGVGGRVGSEGLRLAFALGIGARLFSHPRLKLDLDALGENLFAHVSPFTAHSFVGRVRLAASVTLYKRLALLIAPGYAVMDSDARGERTQAPLGESVLARAKHNPQHVVYGFPSLALGLRVALGDAR